MNVAIKKIDPYSTLSAMLVGLLFVLLVVQRIQLDFWNDEIYTLKHFVLVDLSTTITDYHVPNNHIFFNLINNLYAKMIGIDSLHEALNHPVYFRLVPLIYSLLSLVFFYRMLRKHLNKSVAFLACALLISTISYINFFLQIRGYGLSTLLILLTVSCNLDFLKKGRPVHLIGILIFSTLALYTIPSNVYYLGTLGIINVGYLIRSRRMISAKTGSNTTKRSIYSAGTLLLSLGLVLLLYLPVLADVTGNEYVESTGLFNPEALARLWPNFLAWISNRWPLLILIIWGYIAMKKQYLQHRKVVICFLLLTILPFFLSFIRGDNPPSRLFIVGIPYAIVLMAFGLHLFFRFVKTKYNKSFPWIFLAFVIYLLANYSYVNRSVSNRILEAFHVEKKWQNIYNQYYSFYFEPRREIGQFASIYRKERHDVIVKGCELHGIPNYLDMHDIPWVRFETADSLQVDADTFYMFTNLPFKQYPNYQTELISNNLTYHNLLKVTKQ